jgi:hypothetical protein
LGGVRAPWLPVSSDLSRDAPQACWLCPREGGRTDVGERGVTWHAILLRWPPTPHGPARPPAHLTWGLNPLSYPGPTPSPLKSVPQHHEAHYRLNSSFVCHQYAPSPVRAGVLLLSPSRNWKAFPDQHDQGPSAHTCKTVEASSGQVRDSDPDQKTWLRSCLSPPQCQDSTRRYYFWSLAQRSDPRTVETLLGNPAPCHHELLSLQLWGQRPTDLGRGGQVGVPGPQTR